jgi:hypothetical protein
MSVVQVILTYEELDACYNKCAHAEGWTEEG